MQLACVGARNEPDDWLDLRPIIRTHKYYTHAQILLRSARRDTLHTGSVYTVDPDSHP